MMIAWVGSTYALAYICYVCMYVYAVNVFMKYVYFYEMIIVFKYFLNMATYNNNEKKALYTNINMHVV